MDREGALAKKAEGNKFFKARDLERAVEMYSQAIELDNTDPTFFSNRSACYAGMEEWEKAASDGRSCIACDKNFIKGYFRLALACQNLGNLEDGINAMRRGLAVDASNRDLKNKLKELEDANRVIRVDQMLETAQRQENEGDYSGSIKSAETGLRMDSDHPQLKALLARVRPAFERQEKQRKSSLSSIELLKEEGDDCYRNAQFEGAIEVYSRCLDSIDDKSTDLALKCYSNRAACYKQISNFDGIISDTTAVLEVDPANVKALVRRAQAFEAVERYRIALDDVRVVMAMPPSQVGPANITLINGMQHRLNRVVAQLRKG